jgi:hypothetical protein
LIYLFGLLFWWLRDVGVPLVVGGGAAVLLWTLIALTALRGRRRVALRGFLVVLAGCVAWLAIGTHAVCHRFHNPQFDMFRRSIADPIPDDVLDLEVDSPAPEMFHEGAVVRFRAPLATREAILAHALPGSATHEFAQRFATRLGRDPAVTARVASPDGGYLRYDPKVFAAFDTDDWEFAIGRFRTEQRPGALREAPTDHDIWVYAERGDWGTLVCVATTRGSDRMTVRVWPRIRPRER